MLGEVFLDEVLVHEDGDEGRGRDGDQGPDDAGQFGADDEGDEDGEAHEIDVLAHDARGEDGVFDVDVEEVEEEDGGHLGPGIEGRDQADEQDGDDTAGDGNDVHQTHEDAEQEEVADVQEAEDEGAGEAEDEHQRELAEEPLAGAPFGFLQGDGEAEAVFHGQERHEPAVGVLSLEHEVDAEDEAGEQVEDAPHPVGEGGEEVGDGGGEGVFGALGDGIDAELVGERKALETGDDGRNAGGQVLGELVEVADDGWKCDEEEEGKREEDATEQKHDGDAARDVARAAQLEVPDAVDGGHQHDGEERADVDEGENLAQTPGKGESKQYSDSEEDVAADGEAVLLGRGWLRGRQGAPPSDEMHIVCIMGDSEDRTNNGKGKRLNAGVLPLRNGR